MLYQDLSSVELTSLVRNAERHKRAVKSGSVPASLPGALSGKTVAMTFNKRSTRTRVSTEAAVSYFSDLFHPDSTRIGFVRQDTAVLYSWNVFCDSETAFIWGC